MQEYFTAKAPKTALAVEPLFLTAPRSTKLSFQAHEHRARARNVRARSAKACDQPACETHRQPRSASTILFPALRAEPRFCRIAPASNLASMFPVRADSGFTGPIHSDSFHSHFHSKSPTGSAPSTHDRDTLGTHVAIKALRRGQK
jgi:hypothetical protein